MAARLLQVVVSFTAVTRVQIPSGTPNLFRSLRGEATFGAGTKRHNSVANFWPGLPNRQCFQASGAVLVGTKRHMQFSQIRRLDIWSAVSFCSHHASVLHGFSFLCLQCGNCRAGLAGTIQEQIVDEEWRQSQQIEESYCFPAAKSLTS